MTKSIVGLLLILAASPAVAQMTEAERTAKYWELTRAIEYLQDRRAQDPQKAERDYQFCKLSVPPNSDVSAVINCMRWK